MDELRSNTFEIRHHPRIHIDPVRCARFFKLLPHLFFPNYEYSIWVDASILIRAKNLRQLVEKHLNSNDMALFNHSERDCIYEEGMECIDSGNDASSTINIQLNHYRQEGYPEHNGLVSTGVILRRHSNSGVVRIDTDWWNEVVKFSRRDQLSFNYVAWRDKFHWATIDGEITDNEYFEVLPHERIHTEQEPVSDREQYFLNRINSLENQNEALNRSLSLKIGRRIPLGKKIRKHLRS